MKSAVFGLLSATLLFSAGAAHAEVGKSDAPPEAFGHGGQFGLRVGLIAGYRMIFRYDDSPYCRPYDPMKPESEQAKSCGHAAPLATEFALSYGLIDFLEPYVWLRLGLSAEEETNTQPVQILGLGTRLYTMSDSAFKIFIEPAIAYEFEGEGDHPDPLAPPGYDPNYSKDLVFHLGIGGHYDFHKNVGAFIDGGVTTGVLRGIHSELEVQLGFQGRYP